MSDRKSKWLEQRVQDQIIRGGAAEESKGAGALAE